MVTTGDFVSGQRVQIIKQKQAAPHGRSFILSVHPGLGDVLVALPVALAGLLLLAQPIVAYVLDVLVLDLSPSPRQWAGLAVSLVGIFVAGMKSKQASAAQEA